MPERYSELPLNYIKGIRLLNQEDRTILSGGDHNTFILFDLTESERSALVEGYCQQNIPEGVIEQVNIKVDKLEP